MDFMNSMAYVCYYFYSWLVLHNAPEFVLDLFMPILCQYKITELKELFFKKEYLTPEIQAELDLWDRID